MVVRFRVKYTTTTYDTGCDFPSRDKENARLRSVSPLASLSPSRQTVDLWSLAVAALPQPIPFPVLVLFFLRNGGRLRPSGTLVVCDAAAEAVRKFKRSPARPIWLGRVGPLNSLLSIGGGGGSFIHSHAVPPISTPTAHSVVKDIGGLSAGLIPLRFRLPRLLSTSGSVAVNDRTSVMYFRWIPCPGMPAFSGHSPSFLRSVRSFLSNLVIHARSFKCPVFCILYLTQFSSFQI